MDANRLRRVFGAWLLVLGLTFACAGTALADSWTSGQVITFTQQDFASGGSGANVLSNNYLTVYPSALVVVGKPITGFTMAFDNAASIEAYLPTSGVDGTLDSNLFDPATSSSGVFGGDVLALQLNVDFSDAGITLGSSGIPFGDLLIANYTVFPAFNGLTVRQILADANTDLGGGDSGFSLGELVDIIPTLNVAFDDGGTPSVFAQDSLVAPSTGTGGGGGRNPVPEPPSALLFGTGLLALALFHKRNRTFPTSRGFR